MSDEAPKKRGRPRKSKVPSLSADSIKIKVNSDDEMRRINALIKETLHTMISEDRDIKFTNQEAAVNAMVATCSEFMKSFIIMGYDMEDMAINPVFYARSDLEADALAQYIQRYFVQSMRESH